MGRLSKAERREHSSNVDRIDAALEQIDRRLGRRYERYSDDELRILLVWVFVQTVENGGFAFLFEHPMPGDADYSGTLRAIDSIGATAAGAIFRQALNQFRGGWPPLDPLERATEYHALTQQTRGELDAAILDQVPEIARRLVTYIEANG